MQVKRLIITAIVSAVFLSGCAQNVVMEQVNTRKSIYVYESDITGFNTKNFYYDSGKEVIVFDTQLTSELTKKSIEFIREKTKNPITHVIITHPNPDKFNGIAEFQKIGAKIISSSRTSDNMRIAYDYKKHFLVNVAKIFTEERYPSLTYVDITFDDRYDLYLRSGETIKLTELNKPGVSANQTIAWIPRANALMVGDLVHYRAHAWLEGGIVNGKPVPTLSSWISDLNQLQTMFKEYPQPPIIFGGRGEAVELSKAIEQQKIYLREAERIVTHYITNLGVRRAELKNEKADEHYQAIRREFEMVFPHYQLGYMIQYGVYGLVNSKLY